MASATLNYKTETEEVIVKKEKKVADTITLTLSLEEAFIVHSALAVTYGNISYPVFSKLDDILNYPSDRISFILETGIGKKVDKKAKEMAEKFREKNHVN